MQACLITHRDTESQQGTPLARGHPGSQSEPGVPMQRQYPAPDASLMQESIFCLPPGSPLRPGALSREAFQKGGGGGLPCTSQGARGFFLKCLPGETRMYAFTKKEKPVFSLNPRHPRAEIQGEEVSSMRVNHKVFTDGSKFPSCTSESFPLPTPPNRSPRSQPLACPSLHLLAQNLSRFSRDAHWIRASAPREQRRGLSSPTWQS